MGFALVFLLNIAHVAVSLATVQDDSDMEFLCRPRPQQPTPLQNPCGEPDWQLVFKAVAGVANPQETDQLLIDPYAVWTRQAPYNEDIPAAKQLDTSHRGHYKSSLALNWQRRNIQEVKVSLLDAAGNELIYMIFDGEDSDSMSWYSSDRLLASPWTDVLLEPHNFFSIVGDNNFNRRWFMNKNYGGCPLDAGWFNVVGKIPGPCSYENVGSDAKPKFLYSQLKTNINWSTGANVGEADIFAIFVKMKSRY